jgi:diguanylate cyclase (GGDEF)-like protein
LQKEFLKNQKLMLLIEGYRRFEMAHRETSKAEARSFAAGPLGTTAAGFLATLATPALGGSISASAFVAAGAAGASLLHIWRSSRQERARALTALDQAQRDPLTGLLHRAAFEELVAARLQEAETALANLSVVKLDLRRFREVNDQFGRAAGDAALLHARDRLLAVLGDDRAFARTGGDEFAALLAHERPEAIRELAERWSLAMRDPLSIDGARFALAPSIGLATSAPTGQARPDAVELLRQADVALSMAKSGVATIVAHTPSQSAELKTRKTLEIDLRQALAAQELEVAFQPIWAADGAEMVGAETLARWRHPIRGAVSPLDFVSIAEDRGFIDELGEYVLRRACLAARGWPPHLFVAVNVSPAQFRNEDFVARVIRILDETGLPAHRLELEVTESAIVSDEAKAEEAIMELRARGVRMAVDDFGTGYSSLIYLRRFAFDKIKIDRSFLEALEPTGESAILVESIVHLGRSLGLTVTAEGVETIEQHRFLEALGCHEMQGFLFSKPLTPQDFAARLDQADRSARRDVA